MSKILVTRIGVGKPPVKEKSLRKRMRKSRLNPVNRKRREREFERAYGGSVRSKWVKTLRCIVTLRYGTEDDPIDNVHIETGGISRKADADKVVPMLRSKHRELHKIGQETFARKYPWVDLEKSAEETEKSWQSHIVSLEKRA